MISSCDITYYFLSIRTCKDTFYHTTRITLSNFRFQLSANSNPIRNKVVNASICLNFHCFSIKER